MRPKCLTCGHLMLVEYDGSGFTCLKCGDTRSMESLRKIGFPVPFNTRARNYDGYMHVPVGSVMSPAGADMSLVTYTGPVPPTFVHYPGPQADPVQNTGHSQHIDPIDGEPLPPELYFLWDPITHD